MMPGHKLANALKQSFLAARIAEGQIFGQGILVQRGANLRMRQQSLYLRSEGEQAAVPEVIERLDAEAVASAKQGSLLSVPDGEGEHATKKLKAAGSMLLVRMNDGFGVAARHVAVARALQRRTDIGVVEDLAVVNDDLGAGLIRHRLMAAGDVDNAQPPVPQRDMLIGEAAEIIGTPVTDRRSHAPHRLLGAGRAGLYRGEPRDPTHNIQCSGRTAQLRTRKVSFVAAVQRRTSGTSASIPFSRKYCSAASAARERASSSFSATMVQTVGEGPSRRTVHSSGWSERLSVSQ